MRLRHAVLATTALAVLLNSACLRPGQSRAERDLQVGHASGAGLRVDVEEGLAAIRELRSGKLLLWGGAPAFEMTVAREATADADLELLVDNCSPAAELGAPEVVSIQKIDRAAATQCGWSLRLPADESVRLSVASPEAAAEGPFRFAVLSDVQDAVDELGDILALMNRDPRLSFVLSTGDLSESGKAGQFERFQSELQALNVPFFTTLGNHDVSFSGSRFQNYFGRGSFHFAYRGVHFTMLDSANATIDPIVYDWLDGWLALGRGRIHVVAMHVPPLDPVGLRNGGFASRNEAALVLAHLAESEVDLTLYGHLHSYYRFYNASIEAHVSGGGGAYPEKFDGIERHFLTVDIDSVTEEITVEVVRVD